MWSGEAAASDFLDCAGEPCDYDVLAGRNEFDEITGTEVETLRRHDLAAPGDISARRNACPTSKIDGNDGWEMAWPFPFHEILVVAGGDNVASAKISFINPILVVQDMVFAATTEAAIEDVVAAFESQPHAFANDESAGAELLAQDTKAADFRFGRDASDNSGNGSAVAENVFALACDCGQSEAIIDDGEIVGQSKALEHWVSCFDA